MARETLRVKKLVNRNPHEISGEEIQTSLCLQLYTNSNPSFQHIAHLVKSVIEVGLDSFTQFTKGIFVLSKTRNYTINISWTKFYKKKLFEHTENKIYNLTFLLSKSCQCYPFCLLSEMFVLILWPIQDINDNWQQFAIIMFFPTLYFSFKSEILLVNSLNC